MSKEGGYSEQGDTVEGRDRSALYFVCVRALHECIYARLKHPMDVTYPGHLGDQLPENFLPWWKKAVYSTVCMSVYIPASVFCYV